MTVSALHRLLRVVLALVVCLPPSAWAEPSACAPAGRLSGDGACCCAPADGVPAPTEFSAPACTCCPGEPASVPPTAATQDLGPSAVAPASAFAPGHAARPAGVRPSAAAPAPRGARVVLRLYCVILC